MKRLFILSFLTTTCLLKSQFVQAQLYVSGGVLTIDSGAIVTVKGDLLSTSSISGTGKIVMNGTVSQYLSMANNTIPSLEINNTLNVSLTSAAKLQTALTFVNGRIVAGNNNFTLSNTATASGMGTGKFIETNGTGQVYKELTSNISSFEMPVGISTVYRPVYISSSATAYSSAKIGVKAVASSNPYKTTYATDYLNSYWPITRTGITGTVSAVGQYADPSDITGTEANLRGCFYDGYQWSSLSGSNDAILNRVGAPVSINGGSLYGMTRFVMLGVKSYLQGFYTSNAMGAGFYDLGSIADSTATDSMTVNLWTSSGLSNANPSYSLKTIIHKNGYSNVILPQSTIGSSYYIALKHRNSIETWSANTVLIGANTDYDFTSSLSSAYGDGVNPPLKLMPGGNYALYSGDTNNDGTIDISDMQITENDASDFLFGYNNSDCNGDGGTDISDMQLIENNAGLFIFNARP